MGKIGQMALVRMMVTSVSLATGRREDCKIECKWIVSLGCNSKDNIMDVFIQNVVIREAGSCVELSEAASCKVN